MRLIYATLIIAILSLSSCREIRYKDPNADIDDQVNIRWDMRDINGTAAKMIYSLKTHYLAHSNPPKIILVLNVKNKTSEHIDTKAITETIITELLKTAKFRAIAERERAGQLIEDREFANEMDSRNSGEGEIWDPSKGNSYSGGGIAKPDLIMYGEIFGIEKRHSNQSDVSFKINLKLVDPTSQIVEWQEQNDIRKHEDGGWFGS